MRIAIPLADGSLSAHFGHCREFALLDVNPEEQTIVNDMRVPAPDHQPGLLPRWLADLGVNHVIAGGMGARAQQLFRQQGIDVTVGAPSEDPRTIVAAYLNHKLSTGANLCDH